MAATIKEAKESERRLNPSAVVGMAEIDTWDQHVPPRGELPWVREAEGVIERPIGES